MISTADFRNGMVIRYENELWMIREYQHVKPGKGRAFVRTKMVRLKNNNVLERTFDSGEKFEEVRLDSKAMKFLYKSGDDYVFMDSENYEQLHIDAARVGDNRNYLIEDLEVTIQMVDNDVIAIIPPSFVVLTIVETEPGLRGNTVAGGSKTAKLSTGVMVNVPLFVSTGEKIKVDTRTNSYVERA